MVTQIIAHRGASKDAPENTLPAFKLAYEQGAEAIETDVHLTKDQVPVLMHDERVNRTTNGKGYIKDFTFRELKQLDAGSWFSSHFTGTPITSLEAFLKWVQFKPLDVQIELKNNKINYQHLESIVYEMIREYKLLNRITLSSFNPNSIKQMKGFNQTIQIAYLTSRKRKNMIQHIKDLGANALHIKYRLLSPTLVSQCYQAHIPIRVYTVNKADKMLICFKYKCNGIFTDLPYQGIQQRKLFYK